MVSRRSAAMAAACGLARVASGCGGDDSGERWRSWGIAYPTIGSATAPEAEGLVGLPVWSWIDEPSAAKVGPLSTSASERGLTATLNARMNSLSYDMGVKGPIGTLRCQAPGVKFQPRFADRAPRQACTYLRVVEYPVTATAQWVIEWSGGGRSGTFDAPMTDTVNLRIGEVQTVNKAPG